tara:strand:- start:23322 stop:23501 length:180 start_codon:yes stop_codon:yes gene_type:complete
MWASSTRQTNKQPADFASLENIARVALTYQQFALDMKQDPGPPRVTSTLLQQGKTMSKR